MRILRSLTVAVFLLVAPSAAIAALSPSANAEPKACVDMPDMPGCPHSHDGHGGDGYVYRSFILDSEVSWLSTGILVDYDLSEWLSPYDFSDAVKNYWDMHSTAAECVSNDPGCDFVFLFHTAPATAHKVYVGVHQGH